MVGRLSLKEETENASESSSLSSPAKFNGTLKTE